MNSRTFLAGAALGALLLFAIFSAACSESQLRAGANATATAARVARGEIDDSHRAGELDDAEVASVSPAIDRLEKSAQSIEQRLAGYDRMTKAEKRQLVSGLVDEGTSIAADFDALHVKNPRAQARITKIVGYVRRGNEIFQIVLAALPQPVNK